jgi:hypothetical protein
MKFLDFFNEKIILFFIILAHALFINNYPVSVEFSFIDFAKYYENYDKTLLLSYINIQANTVVYSYLIFLLKNILFIENYHIAGKILSITSYIFLYFGISNFFIFFKKFSKRLLIVLVMLNPIIWIYGFKVTSDLLPASIGFFSISLLFLKNNNLFRILISSLLVSLTAILKPMFLILVFFGSFALLFFNKNLTFKKNIFYILSYIFFPFLFLFIYFYWTYINFGFLLSPHVNVGNKQFDYNVLHVISIFLYYFGIFFIFISPVISLDLNYFLKLKKITFFLLSLIFFYLGFSNKFFPGELDLGTFFSFNVNILKGLYFLFALLIFYFFYINYKNINKQLKILYVIYLITIFLYIFILSFFRPAQRYLILLIPISYVFLFFIKKNINYKIIYFFIFICISVNFILASHSYFRSQLAMKIMIFLNDKSIIEKTEPGPIVDSHNFYIYSHVKKQYKITTIKTDNYLNEFTTGLSFFKISYYLVRI